MTKSTIFSTVLHAFFIAAAATAAGASSGVTIIHPVEANGNKYYPNTPIPSSTNIPTYAPTPDDDTTPPLTPFPTEAIILPVSYNIKLLL